MSDFIFGPSTIYIDVKKRMTGHDIITIPDGYLIDMTVAAKPNMFVIENEIVGHDPFKHIGIQMLKFVTSFSDAKTSVRNYLMTEIVKSDEAMKRLKAGCEASDYRNIDNYLDAAVYGEFMGLVIIDEAKPELHHVLSKINARISVLEFRAFESSDSKRVYVYDTLYEQDDEGLLPESNVADTPEARTNRLTRRAECDTVVVPAKEDGFQTVFIGKNQWYSIRIGAAMLDKIKYIAAYQVAPISAVTHVAKVREIKPYENSGKYLLEFEASAEEITPLGLRDSKKSPQGPVYVKYSDLMSATYLDDAL